MNLKKHFYLFIGNIIVMLFIGLFLYTFKNQFISFEKQILDKKYLMKHKFQKSPKMSDDIIHINIDDNSKLKLKSNHFWSKKDDAKIFDKISSKETSIILCDLLYANRQDTIGNKHLINSIEKCENVISPFVVEYGEENFQKNIFYTVSGLKYNPTTNNDFLNIKKILYTPMQDIVRASYGYGYVNLKDNRSFEDVVIRKIPIVSKINDVIVPSISFESILVFFDYSIDDVIFDNNSIHINEINYNNQILNISIPIDKNGYMNINYVGDYSIQNYPESYSAIDYLEKEKSINLVNKIVVVSDVSASSNDIKQTPFQQMAGSYVLSNTINTIISQDFLYDSSFLFECTIYIILLVLLLFININFKGIAFIVTSIFCIISLILISFTIFIYLNIVFPIINSLILIIGAIIFSGAYKFAGIEKEKGELEGSLRSYLSPVLLKKIQDNPKILKVGGERKKISVIFTDIVGFTEFCDKSEPEEVQLVLSKYLDIFVKIIFKHNGIIDKYLGDGILAFFENDNDNNMSALSSLKCAKELQSASNHLNQKLLKEIRLSFAVKIGISTGYAKVGNIGPVEKIDYTIIGNVVNLASRLESLGNSGDIFLDKDTYFFVKDHFDIISLGEQNIKGYEKKIEIFKYNGK